MKLVNIALLLATLSAGPLPTTYARLTGTVNLHKTVDTRLAAGRTDHGETLHTNTRQLQPDPFVWQPYLIYDGLVGPSFGNNRPPTVTVLWRATSESCEICGPGPSCSTVDNGSGALGDQWNHFKSDPIDISGPPFSATYDYTVTCDGITLPISFKTLPDTTSLPSNTKIIAYGDTEIQPEYHDKVAQAMFSHSLDYTTLALHAGDWVNNGKCLSSWARQLMKPPSADYIRQLMSNVPINGCRGDREVKASREDCFGEDSSFETLYDEIFPHSFVDFETGNVPELSAPPDALSYSFDYGNFHVVVLDQYDGNSYDDTGSSHYQWIKNDLEAANSRDPVPWKIIVIHEPLFSAGGNYANLNKFTFQSLLEANQVNVVAGHNHYYSRGYLNGIYHITTGGGGAPLHPPTDPPPSPITKVAEKYHYCRIDAYTSYANSNDYLCFEAIDICGCLVDYFEIGNNVHTIRICGDLEDGPLPGCCCSDLDCPDDSNPCNGEEFCDVTQQCSHRGMEQKQTCNQHENCNWNQRTKSCEQTTGPECGYDEDCDDGLYCNGAETCDGSGHCQSGQDPCGESEVCDEDSDECKINPCSGLIRSACRDNGQCKWKQNRCTLLM